MLETYKLFLALRNHFNTDSYDFFKYKGKINATKESYEKRHDKFHFSRISKKHPSREDQIDFIIANLLESKEWIGDFTEENYFEYVKRKLALSYYFSNDLDSLFSKGAKAAFAFSPGNYPPIVLKYIQREVSLETLVILDDFTEFSKRLNESFGTNDIIWSKVEKRIRKFRPFLIYDRQKMKNILKEKAFSA